MVKILFNGCNGRMGKAIAELIETKEDMRIVVGVDLVPVAGNFPVFASLQEVEDIEFDVIIDFSHPSGLENLLTYSSEKKVPLVIATTGLSPAQLESLKEYSKKIPIFQSANMSIGICLLNDLVKKAAVFLGDDFDIEIVERHHNKKLDAPSGTAIMIADAINSVNHDKYEYIYDRHSKRAERDKREIGISAVRGGNIIGDHEVIFAGNNEVLEISHKAISRNIFADGAVRAAEFIYKKGNGLYNMNDLIAE
ncbi:MAG: 4-hydroxy-tetrahydrodipicolinate reductase [Clostridiales bacterium]|jgi:4-hydroxy-tetrahydrodipicolinate reductase|nr:4-hydroxy-tetrahydrodipicolinate reductase [Clostridiales bacterium]